MSDENKIGFIETETVEEKEEVLFEAKSGGKEISTSEKNNKIKKLIVVAMCAVAIIVICALLVVNVVIPSIKYNTALELAQAGSYDEAIAIYNEIGNYKDANELVIKTTNMKKEAIISEKIENAQELYKSGEKIKAYESLYEDRNNEKVAEVLEQYKNDLLKEFDDKIYWVEDDMSDYHWAYPNGVKDTILTIYLSQNKNDPSENHIGFATSIISGIEETGFTPPIHPHTVRLQGENGNVDIAVSLNDRKFDSFNSYGLSGWSEDIDVEITLEKAKEIVDVIGKSKEVKMRVIGASSYEDYTPANPGFKDIVDYIELVYLVNGLK